MKAAIISAAAVLAAVLGAGAGAAEPGIAADGAAAEAPRQTLDERFGAWGFSCAVAANGKGDLAERCMVSQIVAANPRKRQVVLGLTVDFADSPDVPTLRARFSSRAEPRAGIGIKIDRQPDMRLPISGCDERRCEAVGRLAPPVLKLWKKGKLAQFAYLQRGGKQVVLPISLDGFDEALAALRKHNRNSVLQGRRQAAL